MPTTDDVIAIIEDAFQPVPYPGDHYLVSSREGCEPGDVAEAFAGRSDWRLLDAAFLDQQYFSLSFFSEAAFRFFLPAYLVADLRGALRTADPAFPLVFQLAEWSVDHEIGGEVFQRRHGGDVLVNPRRYGAMRNEDYARYRLSVFAREEAAAIVAYLEWRRARESGALDAAHITTALEVYWRHRAETAPTQADLDAHAVEEGRYTTALLREGD